MTDVPEHLLRRARERREALGGDAPPPAAGGGGEAPPEEPPAAAAAPPPPDDDGNKIPAHLLARSAARREAAAGGGGGEAGDAGGEAGGEARQPAAATAAAATAVATAPAAARMTGPEGHTQRLLTVVKAGSIQDVKATPVDKVHVWPHLLVGEFVASLFMTAFLLVFSTLVDAPLRALRNYNLTPNPSKAPWYFLGLQELLTMFHPMVAGVTIPGVALGLLAAAPYIDKNPSHKPEDRKFAITMMLMFMMFWAVLVIVGSFFRGPGFNFVLPWKSGVHDIFDL